MKAPAPLIGLVVEGTTEYAALPVLLRRLGYRITNPSVLHGQSSTAPLSQFVEHKLLRYVRAQLATDAARVLVVLDREGRDAPAHELADEIQALVRRRIRRTQSAALAERVFVAVADRTFENWLLADPEGVAKCRLLKRSAHLSGRVKCHADDRDAQALLHAVMAGGWYHKAAHGPRLAAFIRVQRAGLQYCSRSFERFLKLLP